MTKTKNSIHPPYIWFGGKRSVANLVWDHLGTVDHYVEPFFGGGAVWLAMPHKPRMVTVNDYDGFVVNFWRAVQHEPEAVAEAMNWPVNEVDLEARHRWLCRMPAKEQFLERMKHDPDYYSVKRAAWWCWGLNAWLGSGWCGGEYHPSAREQSKGSGLVDGANKRPQLGGGRGIHKTKPQLGGGRGIHRICRDQGDEQDGEHMRRGDVLKQWMLAIRDKLRNVHVCCGDWARVCTDGATSHGSLVGVFLDPPYHGDVGRNKAIYRCEDLTVSDQVRQWCVDRTGQKRYRIVLAGYEGEHDNLESLGWSVKVWKANGGMGNAGKGLGRDNAKRERLWFSPSCVKHKQGFGLK